MTRLSNLRIWNHDARYFEVKDIDVSINSTITDIKEEEIDCSKFRAIPHGIDLHVHFREPGYEYKEDMFSGAESALFGGILTVLDMPNTLPVTESIETLQFKRKLASKQDLVQILLAAGITERNYSQINELNHYCDAYKIFMSESFGDLRINEEQIAISLESLEEIGTQKPIIFHAEDSIVIQHNENELTHSKRRPPEAEAVAVQKVLQWAKDFSSLKFHITHISSSLSMKLLELVNAPNLTADTCPRYLYFDQDSDLPENWKKVNPPLRKAGDRSQLMEHLATGVLDIVSSDHSPHTIDEKEKQQLSGMPGVQELLPSIITLVQSGELEWERALEALHYFPAQLLNLQTSNIEKNMIIIDAETPFEVNSEWIKTKANWSPFQNHMLFGDMKLVVKDGEIVVDNF